VITDFMPSRAGFDKTYNMSALKKRLNIVSKQNDKIYIKTGKLNKKLLKEKHTILKRLRDATKRRKK